MSKLSRNQIIAILVFGVVLLGGALVILSNQQTTDPQVVTVTDEVDATVIAQAATEEPQTEPAPLPTGQRRDGEEPPVEEPPSDKDGDGIPDDQDACPDQGDEGFGVGPDGCPLPPPDRDGDGIPDHLDACPDDGDQGFGVGPDGCPLPPPDRDGDGIPDHLDACPDQGDQGFGLGSDGCPLPPPPTEEPVQPTEEPVQPTEEPVQPTEEPAQPTEEPQVQQQQTVTRSCAIGTPTVDGDTYTFTVVDIQNVSVFNWDLAGIAASGTTVSRDFVDPGVYTITLVCSDDEGNDLPPVTASVTIEEPVVTELACAVNASADGNTLPITVTWSVTGVVGDLDTFTWDFGGGDVATGASVQRTYNEAGVFNVSLTCSGAGGTVGPLSGSVDISGATSSESSLAATFTINVAGGAFPQNAILTSNVTGTHSPFTYAWVITGPDGFSFNSSEANPSFQMPQSGLYEITLTVTDSASPQNTVIARGSINAVEDIPAPIVSISAAPLSGASPLDVTFNAVNTGGPINTYSWNFAGGVVQDGDVNGAGPIVVRFTGFSGQTFNVTLNVEGPDGDGASALRQVVITGQGTAVTARFTYRNEGNVGDLVQMCFTSTSTGDIVAHEWDFNNDGTVDSTEQNPCFNFTTGQHIVNLLVRAPGGETSTSQQLIFVARGAEAPVAAFTVTKTTVNVNENVTPTNLSTGDITTYEWSFGDGGTSSAQNPTHKYTVAGTYVINLRVTGPGGSSEAAAVTVEVVYQAITCPISGSSSATYGNNNFTVSLDSNQLAGRQATVQWLVGGEVVHTGTSYTHSITEAGSTTINIQVLIDDVVVCEASRTVTLTLNAVTCQISGSTSVLLNQSITYSSTSVNNLNGRTIVSRLWEVVSGDVVVSSSTSTSLSYQFTQSGTFTIKMTLTLSDGTTCFHDRTVTVSEESFTCRFDRFPSSATQYVSNEYRVAVTGNTSGGTLSYKWFVNGVDQNRNNRSYTYAHTESGNQTMKVEVYFNGNLVCTAERGIGVGVGATDFCTVTGTFNVFLNQQVSYNMSINNSKLGTRTVEGVEWFIDGTSVQNTGAFNFTNRWSVAGSYQLRVVATTNTGEACIFIETVNVNENELVCDSFDGPTSASQFQNRTYSISTAPSGVANVTYKWFVNDVEQSGTGTSFVYRFTEANSSVSMKVQVFLNGNLVCERTKTVNVSGDPLSCNISGPNANNILLGESYSFGVNLQGANGRAISFAWTLDDVLISSDRNFSYTFTQTTPQTLKLVVTPTLNGQPAGDPCERSFSFTASAAQSISAQANPNVVFVGGSVTFTATTESIDRSTLTWFYPNGTSQRSETGSFTFTQAGDFEIFVEGQGPIRTQRASVIVRVIDYSEISVTFIANPWESLAPREICFVPSTDIDEANITEWLWTFHDGTTSTEKLPCKEYDTPGEFNVQLRVTDGLLVATSTNKVRLYEVIDANATFNVTPRGGLEYCFLPQVSSGVIVSEFEFGDGNSATVTDNGEVCHTYQSEGNYVVRMHFSKDGQQGTVPRTVFITAGVSESFNATAQCEFSGGQDRVTYTITYFGQQMSPSASYPASYSVNGGAPVALGNVAGLSADSPNIVFEVSDRNAFRGATITLSVAGLGELTRVVDCWDRSSIKVEGECLYGVFTFYITNGADSEPMTNPIEWRLVNEANNTVLQSGTVQLGTGETATLTFNNPEYATMKLRFEADQRPGHPGFSRPRVSIDTCLSAPSLTVSGICEYGTGRAIFTVNVGVDGANLPQTTWNATGASDTSGTVGPLNAGSSAQFTVATSASGNATFTVVGFDGATASVADCYKLTLDTICWENTATHTMRVNNGNNVAVNFSWSVDGLSGNGVAEPGQTSFDISGLQYGDTPIVSLYVGDILVATKKINSELCTPPDIRLSGVCAENGVFTFSITGTPFGTANYSVSAGGTIIDSGTFTGPTDLRYENVTASWVILTVSGTGFKTAFTKLYNCYVKPEYKPAGYCEENGVYGFTISHSGGLPIFGGVSFTVYDGETVIDSGTLTHEEAIAFNKTYNSTSNRLRMVITWNVFVSTTKTKEHVQKDCYVAPQITLDGYCEANGVTYFGATLTGNPVGNFTYTIVDQSSNVVDSGDLSDLFNGKTYAGVYQSLTLSVSGDADPVTVNPKTVSNCYTEPKYTADVYCDEARTNGTFIVSISDDGVTPLEGDAFAISYEVFGADGAVLVARTAYNGPDTLTFTNQTYVQVNMFMGGFTLVATAESSECYSLPKLVASALCTDENGVFRFVVNNIGGAVIEGVTLPNYTITDNNGTTLDNGAVELPFDKTVTSENQPLTISFSGGDANIEAESVTSTENCFSAPEFDPNVYCGRQNGVFVINISNKGGNIVETVPTYEIVIDGVEQGAVSFGNADLPVNIELPAGTYGNVKVIVTYGDTVVSADNSECYDPPVWTPSAYCDESQNGVFRFEVTRSGGEPVNGEEPTFTIVTVGNPPYNGAGNLSQLPNSITGRYSSVTLTLFTTEGSISAQAEELTTCYEAPVYVPSVECTDNNGEFTVNVINTGGTPVLSGVNILVDFGNGNSELNTDVTLPFNKTYLGEYSNVIVIVNSEDVEPVEANNDTCYEAPVYVPEIYCAEQSNGTFIFGYTNIGGAPIPGISYIPYYRVFDQDGDVLDEGYADAPFSSSVTGPYSAVTLTLYTNIEGEEVVSTTNELCYVPPVYEPTGYCDEENNGTFYFEVFNNGGTPLLSLPTYEIVDENGNVVDSGSVSTLPLQIGPIVGEYGQLTLIITLGEEGEGSVTVDRYSQNCYRAPIYVPQLTCVGTNGLIAGSVLNAGGEPLFTIATYRMVDNEGNVLAEGIIDELPFTTPSVISISDKVTLGVFINGVTLFAYADLERCYLPPDETPTPTPEPTPTPPGEPVCGETIETPDGQILINLEMCDPDPELGVPEWDPIIIGAAICPDWLVYHTNRTGDWELFRLGDLPDGLTGPENLSRGIGPDVFDIAPSRSPDGMWIAFASTRDTEEGSRVKNWEIYVASVLGDDTRRITYNQFAMDLDPVWSPDGTKIAYETTTDNGDWEIRVFDVLTGANVNITNHPANDINPYWSPDGTKLLIQSDREDGLWQIYEIDLSNNNAITRLSDGKGDDHDPMYSNDGTLIVFRSYRDDPRPETDRNRQSAVYYMNADGTDPVRVSELGGMATNHVFSPDDKLIAYQSTLANGINDIYVYEIESGITRLLTNNQGERYQNVQNTSPTWYCNSTLLVFTSDIDRTDENPYDLNIFTVDALPIDAPPINVDEDATRLTDDTENDRDPQNSPAEENASRHGQVPPKWRP